MPMARLPRRASQAAHWQAGDPPRNPGHQEPQSPCVALWVCLPPLPPTEKKQKSKLHYTWILSLKHDCWANGVLQSGAGSRLVQNKCRMNSKAVTREIMDHLTAPGKSKRSKTGWLRPGQGARGVRIRRVSARPGQAGPWAKASTIQVQRQSCARSVFQVYRCTPSLGNPWGISVSHSD